ncbi:uncharacterized protein [Nicotiana sylvestris]|uniref:uncharacterized protein n=1 Tax=Nicotiana sylvestris TaxID=4096 RepID=UPI00388CB017
MRRGVWGVFFGRFGGGAVIAGGGISWRRVLAFLEAGGVKKTIGVGGSIRTVLYGVGAKITCSQYVGPYKIIQRIGEVAYELDLPPEMSLVHPVFHVSMLKKVVRDPSAIVTVETIEVNEELSYEEFPVTILDRHVRKWRNKEIASVKVLWQNQQVEEATWEAEEEMRKNYPHLFV